MGELAAVAVLHRRQHAARRIVDVELNLGDPRQVLAHFVAIVARARAELVEIDLLIEAEVLLRPLARPGMPRVVEAAAVGRPGQVAARRAGVHVRHDLIDLPCPSSVE